jgi:hypothetical protein
LTSNVITGNGGHGIEAASGSGYAADDRAPLFIITDNLIVGNGFINTKEDGTGHYRSGIYITGHDHIVSDNTCKENHGGGIVAGRVDWTSRIVISGNMIDSNNQANDTRDKYGSGIVCLNAITPVSPPPDQLILIKDNLVTNTASTQNRAIYCDDTTNGIIIEGNRVDGHAQPQITFDSSAPLMVVRDNEGFRTSTTGAISWASPTPRRSGSSTVDLASVLDIDDVGGRLLLTRFDVTLTSESGAGYTGEYLNYWVTQVTDTAFEISWDSGSPLGTISFVYWYDD